MQIRIYSLRKKLFVFSEFFEQCSLGCTSFVRTVYKFPHCIILLFSLFFALHYFVIFIIFPVSALQYFVIFIIFPVSALHYFVITVLLLFQFPNTIILLLFFSGFPVALFFYPNFFQFPGCVIFVIIFNFFGFGVAV